MALPETTSAETEHVNHDYTGNRIPWWVRGMWIGYWIFAIIYTFRYVIPTLQVELFQRP